MKKLKYVVIVAFLIGLGFLGGAFFLSRSTISFLSQAVRAEGTVVDFERRERRDSESRLRVSYYSVVQFISQNGEKIEFTSSVGLSSPNYSRGQKVEVLYLPANPQGAKINSFLELWSFPIFLGGFGGLAFLIGTGFVLADMLKRRKHADLRAHGTPIETEFKGVEIDTSLTVNNRHPFQVLTHWQDPSTSKVYEFKSDHLWVDPTSRIGNRRIRVFIDRNNPRKYFVDLSFLPEADE